MKSNKVLSVGAKIYYLDYEKSGKTYTVVGISDEEENEFRKGGLYYTIHADDLNNATGYYPLYVGSLDKDRFFSSELKAHKAFIKFLAQKS